MVFDFWTYEDISTERQYSASTTYVFAWSEIYVQGLWALLLVALPVALALSQRTYVLDWDNWQFYLLQVG